VLAYGAANGAAAFFRREARGGFEAGLLTADIVFLGWITYWSASGESHLALAFALPLTLAVLRLETAAASGTTVLTLSSLLLASRWHGSVDPADLGYRLAVLTALSWGLGLTARSASRSRTEEVQTKSALHRSMIFHEFLSHVLFQMREYLTSITTVSTHLAATAPEGQVKDLSGKLARMIGELNGKIKRMFETVESHSTTRRPPQPAQLGFSLGELLHESLDLARAAYPIPELHPRVWCDPQIGPLQGDRRLLLAVFATVIENSLESFLLRQKVGDLNISARKLGELAQVEIVDDAGGMLPGDLERAFQPLFTTKAATGHVGLGLSMSRRIIERYGGTLSLRSEKGRAMVRVEIPLSPTLPRIRTEESTWAGRRPQSLH